MKIVILTANYGNGHKSVAQSISQEIGDDAEVLVVDPRVFDGKRSLSDKIPEYMFNNVVSKYPRNVVISNYYHASYKLGSMIPICREIIKRGATKKVGRVVDSVNPDVIITTFPHYVKIPKDYQKNLDIYTVITDYTFEKVWFDKQIKGYFVPSKEIKDSVVSKGVDPSAVHITGIPVGPQFFSTSKSNSCNNILITFGARGQISERKVTKIIDAISDHDLKVTIVCGSNVKLKAYLELYCDPTKFIVHSYVDNMNELLKQCDVVLTKAGGISVSEAIVNEKPMLINKSLSMKGQEQANIDFIEKHKIGLICDNDSIVTNLLALIEDDVLYTGIKQNIVNMKHSNYSDSLKGIILPRNDQ